MISKAEKVKEAVRRMNAIGLFREAIRIFETNGRVLMSEPPIGAVYTPDDELISMISAFEKEYDALVYHVVRSFTEIGVLDTFLYVSDYQEEWELETPNFDKEHNCFFVSCYVENEDDNSLSEFGEVGIRTTIAAGLVRCF